VPLGPAVRTVHGVTNGGLDLRARDARARHRSARRLIRRSRRDRRNGRAIVACAAAHAPYFDPALQALQTRVQAEIDPPTSIIDQCASPTTFHTAIRGPLARGVCKSAKQVVRMVALSSLIGGKVYRDIDRLKLRCDPAPNGCSSQALFSGTFDSVSSFGEDARGELYVTDLGSGGFDGEVFKIVPGS